VIRTDLLVTERLSTALASALAEPTWAIVVGAARMALRKSTRPGSRAGFGIVHDEPLCPMIR
jgi:hypothetical protein